MHSTGRLSIVQKTGTTGSRRHGRRSPVIQTAAKKEKVTLSSAGAELQGRERKRAREEAGHRGEANQAEEEEEDSEADARSSDEQPNTKRRRSEAGNKEISEDDANSMHMADSDGEE